MANTEISPEQYDLLKYYRDGGYIADYLEMVVQEEDDAVFSIHPHERAALRAIWDYSVSYYCWSRRLGKTFSIGNGLIGLASLLTGIPTSLRIGVLSGTRRQVRLIFDEIIKTYDKSPFLQSISVKPPKKKNEICEWELKGWNGRKGHRIEGYPLNSQRGAETLRGLGFQIMVIDEFQLVPRDCYQVLLPIISGTSSNYQVSGGNEDRPDKNRLILAGTAYYEFCPAFGFFDLINKYSMLNQSSNELLNMMGDYIGEDSNKPKPTKEDSDHTTTSSERCQADVLELELI